MYRLTQERHFDGFEPAALCSTVINYKIKSAALTAMNRLLYIRRSLINLLFHGESWLMNDSSKETIQKTIRKQKKRNMKGAGARRTRDHWLESHGRYPLHHPFLRRWYNRWNVCDSELEHIREVALWDKGLFAWATSGERDRQRLKLSIVLMGI